MQERSGISAEELFLPGSELSYDHFLLKDTFFTDINRKDISLLTNLGKGITLETPIIAAPMDTVTNAKACIALALQGGIGAIHYNHKNGDKPDINAQAAEVALVKRYQAGFIEHPIVVSPDMTIGEAVRQAENFTVGAKKGRDHSHVKRTTSNENYSKLQGNHSSRSCKTNRG